MQALLYYREEQRQLLRQSSVGDDILKKALGPTLISCNDFKSIESAWPKFAEHVGNGFNSAISSLWHGFLGANEFDVRA